MITFIVFFLVNQIQPAIFDVSQEYLNITASIDYVTLPQFGYVVTHLGSNSFVSGYNQLFFFELEEEEWIFKQSFEYKIITEKFIPYVFFWDEENVFVSASKGGKYAIFQMTLTQGEWVEGKVITESSNSILDVCADGNHLLVSGYFNNGSVFGYATFFEYDENSNEWEEKETFTEEHTFREMALSGDIAAISDITYSAYSGIVNLYSFDHTTKSWKFDSSIDSKTSTTMFGYKFDIKDDILVTTQRVSSYVNLYTKQSDETWNLEFFDQDPQGIGDIVIDDNGVVYVLYTGNYGEHGKVKCYYKENGQYSLNSSYYLYENTGYEYKKLASMSVGNSTFLLGFRSFVKYYTFNSNSQTFEYDSLFMKKVTNYESLFFGDSIDSYENFFVVGVPNDSPSVVGSGSVMLFKREDDDSFTQVARMYEYDSVQGKESYLGQSVAIHENIVVASSFYDVIIFKIDLDDYSCEIFQIIEMDYCNNVAVDINEENIFIGNSCYNSDNGAIIVLSKNESGLWEETQQLTPASEGYHYFGISFSFSENYGVVGTSSNFSSFYEKSEEGKWELMQTVHSPYNFFGYSVSLFESSEGAKCVIGSAGINSAFLYELKDNVWTETRIFSENATNYTTDNIYSNTFVSVSDCLIVLGSKNLGFSLYSLDSSDQWNFIYSGKVNITNSISFGYSVLADKTTTNNFYVTDHGSYYSAFSGSVYKFSVDFGIGDYCYRNTASLSAGAIAGIVVASLFFVLVVILVVVLIVLFILCFFLKTKKNKVESINDSKSKELDEQTGDYSEVKMEGIPVVKQSEIVDEPKDNTEGK